MFSDAEALIFERYKHPQHAGEPASFDLKGEGANAVCGDEITLWASLDPEGRFSTIRHQCRACAICSASADLLAENLIGKTPAELDQLPSEYVQKLLDIPLSPLRLKCALLPLETLRRLEQA